MQPTENYSTPRRTLDVEDYIDIARRHDGWIAGTTYAPKKVALKAARAQAPESAPGGSRYGSLRR